MNELQDGIWLRSRAEAFALSGVISFDLSFLSAARHMAAPEVAALEIRISGTVNSSAGTDASGFDACKLVDNFRFTDKDIVVDCSGQGLRLNEIIELGERQVDMTTLAAGAADAVRTFGIVIPFHLPKAERPRDTRVPLEHFLEGGQIDLAMPAALPTGWDGFTAGTVQLRALVVDGRRKELKSRLVIREEQVTLQEHWYGVNGSCRSLVLHSKLTTTSQTSLAGFTVFNSTTLKLPPNAENDMLVRRYRLQGGGGVGFSTADPIIAATPLAVPLITPDQLQKIGAMPDLKTCHVLLNGAAPAGGRMLISAIKDRNVDLALLVGQFGSLSDYQAALMQRGRVVSAKGKNVPATEFLANLVRRLPVEVGGGIVG